MDRKTKDRLTNHAAIFKAMGHPTRLFIIEQLARKEKSVLDLTEMVGSQISTVSRHLSVLKNAGIVRDNRRGYQVYYSLRFPCVLDFFSCSDSIVKSVAREALKTG